MRSLRSSATDDQPRRERDGARRRELTWGQTLVVGALLILNLSVWLKSPEAFLGGWILISQIGFLALVIWRILLVIVAVKRPHRPAAPVADEDLPRYTIMAALYDEAEVVSQLIERLSRIDYPADRLEAFLLLEAHDLDTQSAAAACERPPWLSLIVVPPGQPQTKPRALNYGLARASGEFVTIYDAEDEPDPQQLREAVSRFRAPGMVDVACLQAPLLIRTRSRAAGASPFLDRQFAVEYAALFGVTLPAMARLRLPFPLGGTSNHFRANALRAAGGWDAWNVTEDADLGFQLWRDGWRLGILERPTYESPPGALENWLPQRARWLKGYMQTLGVHTRDPAALGLRGLIALIVTMGGGLASAASHAVAIAWAAAWVLVSVMAGLSPELPMFAVGVLVLAVAAAWLQCAIGARRGQVPYTAVDMIMAPAYWSLLTLAFLHAVWRLLREPFVWDKTHHLRDEEPEPALLIAPNAGRQPA
jgi:cellulose synthase/poly-beta-1,6-N-acetylglucosamine synthase-like glycosyltransferase